jgi:RNA polymerase sigma-70 factor, ECF subfamily
MEEPEYSDQELLRIVRSDDEEFLKVLFRLYYNRLCTYAETLVKTKELAEEIVQDTFVDFWEKRDDIRIDHSVRAYIFRSVHNNCINHLKKSAVLRRYNQEMADEIAWHNELAVRNFNPEIIENLAAAETEFKLNKALEELPPQARKIFLMSRFEQQSYDQIAKALDLSVNTVKTHMKRTLTKLRRVFDRS